MKNAVDGQVEQVLVKVFGFGDAERHSLNTVFRLSQEGPVGYTLWTEGTSATAEVVLMDGESWEAGVELARPSFKARWLIWVGDYPPPQAWKTFSRPLRWNTVVEAMDQLFASVPRRELAEPGELDFDLSEPEPQAQATEPAAAASAGTGLDLDLDVDFDTAASADAANAASGEEDASTQPGILDQAEASGDDFITIPADLDLGDDTPAASRGPRVLLVDADRDTRLYLTAKLASTQLFNIDEAATNAQAAALAAGAPYQLVILSLELGLAEDGNGVWALLRQLRQTGRAEHILLTTDKQTPYLRLRAWLAGAGPVMVKPFHPARLMRRIDACKRTVT